MIDIFLMCVDRFSCRLMGYPQTYSIDFAFYFLYLCQNYLEMNIAKLYLYVKYLLYTYFNTKQRLHVNPYNLEFFTLIGEKEKLPTNSIIILW
jgi:hypothetical protein